MDGWLEELMEGRVARKNSNAICFVAAVCCDCGMDL
jgi:hypothetical protein